MTTLHTVKLSTRDSSSTSTTTSAQSLFLTSVVIIGPQSNKLDNYHAHHASRNSRDLPPPGERPWKRPRLASKYLMDPPHSSSNSNSSHSQRPNSHHPRTTSAYGTVDHQGPVDGQAGDTLRRGYSDGDVLTNGPKPKSRVSTDAASAELIDVLRQSPGGRQDSFNRVQLAASRAAIMASDRRRRLTEHPEEQSRRRSSGGLSFVHPGSLARSRQNFTQPGIDRPSLGPPSTANNPPSQRITDRPLPRRPSSEILQNRRSRDITLPRWEPDAGVSKCPICGTTFSFWYRKHHCRKCGRVVCANCSPHRITIPRQFIVHAPEDANPSPGNGIEVVDLTGDDDTPRNTVNPEARPPSSEYRIDPALGGGQEVRLCNPCVPDPNPLPHLPYVSTSRHTLDSFPRPENAALDQPLPPIARLSSSGDEQQQTLGGRMSGHSANRPNNTFGFGGVTPLVTSPTASSSTSTRHSQAYASRPPGPPIPMPLMGYTSPYGSAPDQNAHEVSFSLAGCDLNRQILTYQSVISHRYFSTVHTIVTMYL